jgi:hypothetical protein
VTVETHSGLLELQPAPWLSLRGEVVYDAISGASPTGAPPPSQIKFDPSVAGPFKDTVPVAELTDIRWAGTFDGTVSLGPHHVTPQFAYSEENDYVSYGAALNYALDLNEKNTTLNAGYSHNWDRILPNGFLSHQETKDTDDILIGVNQILGPGTVLTFNFTYGHAQGYLNDQYKGVLFESDPQLDPESPALTAERRPETRDRYIAYASFTQWIGPAHASVEGSYRFFHDSYDIDAHTLSVAWLQKLGKKVVLSPLFRYYRQSAASFYAVSFPDYNMRPEFYSADYRLSELETFTYGVTVSVKALDWLTLDAGYKRYDMHGLDGVTSQSAYPVANVFTMGARLWF